MKVTLKDGSEKIYKKGMSVLEIAADMSSSLARMACAAEVNGQLVDLRYMLEEDVDLHILTFHDAKGQDAFRHTTAHILAQAVKRLYPEAKLAIGPSIENGFYYDFDIEKPFTSDDLPAIEKEMKKIIKENYAISRFELSKDEAIRLMKEKGEDYKVELIENLKESSVISFYGQGEFVDLCAGPHLMSTKSCKAFKLLSVAGAYWHGDEKNKMLSRIYGTSFTKKANLDAYLERLEEAKKRDHRKLGKTLELFAMFDEGPGFPFFLPKGMVLRNTLMDYWRQVHNKANYHEIATPVMLNKDLWIRSGHWEHYRENMYTSEIDQQEYAIKPMNCPGGMLVYRNKIHSYKELPLRIGELGLVHRHELSGTLHGLMRVRNFTQDDAHIFMLPEQVKDEIVQVIHLIDEMYKVFGFQYHMELSTRPDNSIGSDEDWEMATHALKEALDENGLAYVVNEGDGAFYGPKIDFHLEDCLGRTWQCGTIQLDFQLPERFELEYIGQDGEKHRPVTIHRVVFGSIERFIGILIEHFAGVFPMWLAPVQVKVLPISDKYQDYATDVVAKLKANGIRVELDDRAEKIGYKIREGRMERVPYLFILGQKEAEEGLVAVRSRVGGDEGGLPLNDVISRLRKEIDEKVIPVTEEKEQ
ncbi:threonine--tRNA ligase [Vallitalea pronyensis]|uniref:Threonine--tRNA ligase n=1 Tax=Vallitalea pronyensis TaxID=1348613 RepID=A0A8J8SI99_9FIRM|nr:threonine--tRNA ligase [Vallitalea pronyensis]QUI24700.1 threonine--tRNA ligase [Vallitalea pronyensis]